jgi:hypothetical protein
LRRSNYILYFVLLISGTGWTQSPDKIKFAKNSDLIYFFQVGTKSDTISKGVSDKFYLIVPDSLKESILFSLDNAQLIRSENDSMVICNYLPGLRYESIFLNRGQDDLGEELLNIYEFKTLVNGTSVINKKKIIIQVIDRRKNKVLMENEFFVR